MNRTDLARALAEKTGLSNAAAQRVVDALFGVGDGIILSALQTEGAVSFGAFGKMTIRNRGARTGRNPQTGRALRIEASMSAVFRAGAALKQRLEHGPDDDADGFGFRAPSPASGGGRWRDADVSDGAEAAEAVEDEPARSGDVHGSGGGGRDFAAGY